MNYTISKNKIIYRDLRQIKRDLRRNLEYVSQQTIEALYFISELEEKGFSNKIGRKLLTRLRRLELDEDLMEMALAPDEDSE